MSEGAFLESVIAQDGMIEPERLSGLLRVTRSELAMAAGLSRESVSKTARLRAQPTQTRLREVAEIINRILPWCGSTPQAFAWYRSQPLPSFGDQTAEDLVRAGRAEHVLRYLSRVAAGGYA
jgi:transcriptional regulator with XRE-family HTH domain